MATSGKQLSSLPSASSIAGNNEFLTWVGNDTAQKVSRDDFIKSLPTYRQPSTAYTAGQIAYYSALPTGWYLECTTAGTSSNSDTIIITALGGTVTDGTVVWTIRAVNNFFALKSDDYQTDLDNLKTEGIYRINATGFPSKGGNVLGSLLAFNTKGRIFQMAVQAGGSDLGLLYNRVYIPGRDPEWTDWLQQEGIIAKVIAPQGYIRYSSGLIVQWGSTSAASGSRINFPISYNLATFAPLVFITYMGSENVSKPCMFTQPDNLGFTLIKDSSSAYVAWLAIGY